MGVDIYLKPRFSRVRESLEPEWLAAVARRDAAAPCDRTFSDEPCDCPRCCAQKELSELLERMYPPDCYIRSSYNRWSLFGWLQENLEAPDLLAFFLKWEEEVETEDEVDRRIVRVKELGQALMELCHRLVEKAQETRITATLMSFPRFDGPSWVPELMAKLSGQGLNVGTEAPPVLSGEDTMYFLKKLAELALFAQACVDAEEGSYVSVSY